MKSDWRVCKKWNSDGNEIFKTDDGYAKKMRYIAIYCRKIKSRNRSVRRKIDEIIASQIGRRDNSKEDVYKK